MRIVVLPGAGREMTDAVLCVLDTLALPRLVLFEGDIGAIAVERHGSALPEETRAMARGADAVLVGAAEDAAVLTELRAECGDKVYGPLSPEDDDPLAAMRLLAAMLRGSLGRADEAARVERAIAVVAARGPSDVSSAMVHALATMS